MSKSLYRPPPAQHSYHDDDDDDDEVEDDDDDDDDDDQAPPARSHQNNSNNQKKKINISNANLSDDEEDDDGLDDFIVNDQEDDEDAKRNKRKKSSSGRSAAPPSKKRPKASSFFDEEAEASDDDDEEEEGRAARHENEDLDEEARELIRQQDRRRAQAGRGLHEMSVEQISREIENRHRLQGRTINRATILDRPLAARPSAAGGASALSKASSSGGGGDAAGGTRFQAPPPRRAPPAAPSHRHREEIMEDEEGGPEVYTAVAQQSLVPSVSDPSLWMISCSTGKEQELVFQIMNKCIAFARQGKPLGICGAIAAQTKGKIYIESYSEPAVVEAIQNVRGILQYTMHLVPIQDMTTVMTVVSHKKPVQVNEWVRMTRGHYKGDLALVMTVKESGLKCIVQCVPRLDLSLSGLPPEEARLRRRTIRPPQKFFNPQELQDRAGLRRQRFPGLDIYCDYYEGNYYHDGYLLKEMTVGSMVKPCSEEDPPSLDELQRFQRHSNKKGEEGGTGEENAGSKLAASLLDELSELQGRTSLGAASTAGKGLILGDTVEVTEGDLIGMRGKLVYLDTTTVKVKPYQAGLELGDTDEVEFLISQVRKHIAVGAHVKVTEGRYANETGVVVAVEQLDGDDDFTAVVLTDITNKEISVRTSQLRESAEIASGQDKLSGYELYDLVVLSGGGANNEVGVIVRVGQEDFTVINNHGIVREVRPEELRGKRNSTSSRAVALDVQGNQIRVGDSVNVAEGPHKGKTATIKRLSRAQLFLHSQTRTEHAGIFVVRSRSCVLAGTRSQNRGSAADAGASPFATPQSQTRAGPVPRGKRDDTLIGKTVRIKAGPWKGYLGVLTDSTATHVQVELHSRLKKIMVVRERVMVAGDKFGATENGSDVAAGTSALTAAAAAMATPMHAIGGATPAIHGFGGATPSHSDGTDDFWRPGAIDQESIKTDDGWGSTANDPYDLSSVNEQDGWGASSSVASTWGTTTTQKKEGGVSKQNAPTRNSDASVATSVASVKREQLKSEMENDLADIPVWFMERVCVLLKSEDKVAVIKEIYPSKTALVELEDKTTRTVRVTEVAMIPPVEHDTVLVTGGNEIGLEGSLVCVDGTDAILKDANDEFKIIDFVHLVKISSES